MTTFFNELQELKTSKENFKKLLINKEIAFKEKDLIKDKVQMIILDNKVLSKFSFGVNYGTGKHKVYYIKEDNTILLLSNSYGWTGQGQPYSTSNHIRILKSDNEKRYLELTSLKDDYSIREYEKEIKSLFVLTSSKPKNKLYEDEVQFSINNPKLFCKYLKETISNILFFNPLSNFSLFDDKYIFNEDINYHNIGHFDELNILLQNFSAKVNKKIKNKIPKPLYFRHFVQLLELPEVKTILLENNLELTHITYSENVLKSKGTLFFGLNVNKNDYLNSSKKIYEKSFLNKTMLKIFFNDTNESLEIKRQSNVPKNIALENIANLLKDEINELDLLKIEKFIKKTIH